MSKIKDAYQKMQITHRQSNNTTHLVRNRVVIENANTELGDIKEVKPILGDCDGGSAIVDMELLRTSGMLAPRGQERQVAEQFRSIKRPLLDNVAGKGADRADNLNLIMISSALPGDGKTFSSINLALSIAQEKDTSVLLVDADIARPNISELFGVTDKPGLTDLISDARLSADRILMRTNVPGLRILPAGTQHEQATELLASRRMAQLADILSKTFPDRVVIFDSPPLLVTNEARVLASLMGQIVIVIGSGRTLKHDVIKILDYVDDSKAVSLIFNRATPGIGESHYGYYNYGL